MNNNISIFLIIFLLAGMQVIANEAPFKWSSADTLVINDGLSKQQYLLKDGLLTLVKTITLSDNRVEMFSKKQSDRSNEGKPRETRSNISRLEKTERVSGYYQLNIHSVYDTYEVIRTLRKYDNVLGIEWGMLIKGDTELFQTHGAGDSDLIENPDLLISNSPYYLFMPFSSPHKTTSIFSFREATDHHTNIVYRRYALPYRKSENFRGSLFLAENNHNKDVNLIVKLAPIERAQSVYTGFDFSTDFTGVKVHSPGLDLSSTEDDTIWKEAYSLFVLMHAENEFKALEAYKSYELAIHKYIPDRDNTFTMNTWGDRNRDSRVNEEFILNELGVAKRLGITHYQIDDGWQQGLSRNSAASAGQLWDDWDASHWEFSTSRFPNGLMKVKETADQLGIELGLWFNPSKANNYATWKRDQDILLNLHKRYGISWIKIDGLEIGSKLSEERVNDMLGGAIKKSNSDLQFNIDVTAGKRGGYFYFNHFGNIFLENRYTDWGNYYPHLTLRNAWTLAKYVPIQRFQIEWLNKWRNDNQYPENDPLKPSNVPFDYQFAIAMIGQPLAWMEATGLPEEAFEVSTLLKAWKEVRSEMQEGVISPIGDEPNGYSYPGFVSYGTTRTFVLLFRENTSSSNNIFSTSTVAHGIYQIPEGNIVEKQFVPLAGEGVLSGHDNDKLEVVFQKPFQFLFGYFE